MAGEVHSATITAARVLPGDGHVRELTLRPGGGASGLAFRPGQWLSLRLPLGDHPPLVRAYTLAAPADPSGDLVLCFDLVESGLGSPFLWDLPVGASVEFTGPLGNFVLPDDGDAPLLLLAHYTGVVPFRAMVLALSRGDAPPRPVRLVHAGRAGEHAYSDELTRLAADAPWFAYEPVTGDDPAESVAAALEAAPAAPGALPFVCGVRSFTKPVRDLLMARFGYERRAVKIENYNGPEGAAR